MAKYLHITTHIPPLRCKSFLDYFNTMSMLLAHNKFKFCFGELSEIFFSPNIFNPGWTGKPVDNGEATI